VAHSSTYSAARVWRSIAVTLSLLVCNLAYGQTTTPPAQTEPTASPVVRCSIDPEELCIIRLRNGTILIGIVRGFSRGERIVIRLTPDKLREIAWTDINQATPVRDTTAAPAPISISASPPVLQPLPVPENGPIMAQLRPMGMKKGMRIQTKDSDGKWRTRCEFPCPSVALPALSTFKLRQSDGLSEESELPTGTRVTAVIKAGHHIRYGVGISLMVLGAVATLSGVGMELYSAANRWRETPQYSFLPLRISGGVLIGAGVSSVVIGGVLTSKGTLRIDFRPSD
jgi:hypothetical protein